MVATSPVHEAPTPFDNARTKAREAARNAGNSDLPLRFAIPTDEQLTSAGTEYLNALDLRFLAKKVIEETGVEATAGA